MSGIDQDRINEFRPFIHQQIGLTYRESGEEKFLRGELVNVSTSGLTIRTSKNVLLIEYAAVIKIKTGCGI